MRANWVRLPDGIALSDSAAGFGVQVLDVGGVVGDVFVIGLVELPYFTDLAGGAGFGGVGAAVFVGVLEVLLVVHEVVDVFFFEEPPAAVLVASPLARFAVAAEAAGFAVLVYGAAADSE